MKFSQRCWRCPFYCMSHGTAAPSERDWNAAIITHIDVLASELPSLTRLFKGSNERDLCRPLAAANDRNISTSELSISAGDPKKYSSEQSVWDVHPLHRQHFKPFHCCCKYRQFFKLPEPSTRQSLKYPRCVLKMSHLIQAVQTGSFEEKAGLAMGGS